MLTQRITFRWAILIAVIAASAAVTSSRTARADDPPAPPTDDKKDDKEELKNPSDIRNSIGNAAQVRTPATRPAAAKGGLWSQLVDQPYYTPAVRAANSSSSVNTQRQKRSTANSCASIRKTRSIPTASSRRSCGRDV